ncbi:hypothetical protein ATANTOWER_013295 [Ataeniobius toweri]|uniref:Uncharacterized protein n=1 Tax=Ataeniobius toweri TaxID=208326 RepID=A0ABU7AH36_9TELE|nr:hypothetical protein [Ataeniobius toweri]
MSILKMKPCMLLTVLGQEKRPHFALNMQAQRLSTGTSPCPDLGMQHQVVEGMKFWMVMATGPAVGPVRGTAMTPPVPGQDTAMTPSGPCIPNDAYMSQHLNDYFRSGNGRWALPLPPGGAANCQNRRKEHKVYCSGGSSPMH